MNILVIGGTRYMGVHLVKNLLRKGHKVTIATRGIAADNFGNSVERIILERYNPQSITDTLNDKYFDVVYDSLAYSSNDIKYLLDVLKCGRYIETSTLSVYKELKKPLLESDFDPLTYPLTWCSRDDFTYDEVKRQAECALYQVYNHIPSVSVRFPYVIGEDDYTKRLYFYAESIVNSVPMYIDNINEEMAFVNSGEAGKFLAFMADNGFLGSINAASYGSISLAAIIAYIEDKALKKAVITADGLKAPYNGTPRYSMDLSKSEKAGFCFSNIDTWLYELLDSYIKTAESSRT